MLNVSGFCTMAMVSTPQPLVARGIVMTMTGGRAGGAGGRADQSLSGA